MGGGIVQEAGLVSWASEKTRCAWRLQLVASGCICVAAGWLGFGEFGWVCLSSCEDGVWRNAVFEVGAGVGWVCLEIRDVGVAWRLGEDEGGSPARWRWMVSRARATVIGPPFLEPSVS
jgi:hypothetical protein